MESKTKLMLLLAAFAIVALYFSHITLGILGDFGDGLEQGIRDFARYLSELLLLNQWL